MEFLPALLQGIVRVLVEAVALSSKSEWLSLTALFRIAECEVHVIHISRGIITYTLESLSSLT